MEVSARNGGSGTGTPLVAGNSLVAGRRFEGVTARGSVNYMMRNTQQQLVVDDAAVYRTQARDIHQQGVFLVTHKYRYLRIGYAAFLGGFAAASVVVAIDLAVS